MATQAQWPLSTLAPRLGLLLTGETQKAYSGILLANATNYNKVKEAILHWLEVAEELNHQRFCGKKASGAGSPPS